MTCASTSRWTGTTRALCVALGVLGLQLGQAGVALAQSQAINGTSAHTSKAVTLNHLPPSLLTKGPLRSD